jgi:hypothetical protein
MVPPEAPEATEAPKADGAPIVEEVVEVTPRRAASTGSEGACSSPQPLVLEVALGAGAAPSPPRRVPHGELGEPSRGAGSLALAHNAPLEEV